MVFQHYLEHNSQIALSDVVDKLLRDERVALDRTFQFLHDSNIAFVDPLPAMQAAAGPDLFAHSAGDMHPNKNGYRIIANAVAESLNQSHLEQSALTK
jgi:hypothetical protein